MVGGSEGGAKLKVEQLTSRNCSLCQWLPVDLGCRLAGQRSQVG